MTLSRRLTFGLLALLLSAAIPLWLPTPALAVGGQLGLEVAIDAPWRLEPYLQPDGSLGYGPIPITITFHDAIFDDNRSRLGRLVLDRIKVGTVQEVEVLERTEAGNSRKVVTPGEFREIERKMWISQVDLEPTHEICRPSEGEDCAPLYRISNTGAWHAMFWYEPSRPLTPGQDLYLRIKVKTAHGDKSRAFSNRLVVHAGEAPLPRFDRRWLYGDLHYHSQMTDNEGESGYSYGNVSRTLGAMGLDFVFATDHASGGKQVLSEAKVKRCGSIYGPSCVHVGPPGVGMPLDPVCPGECRMFSGDEARDLNPTRFQAAKQILYGPDGVNLRITRDARSGALANFNSRRVLPQVYMAEELDAWPEMSAQEQRDGLIRYGDGLTYAWPDNDGCLQAKGSAHCRQKYSEPHPNGGGETFLVRDLQGLPIEETVQDTLDNKYVDGKYSMGFLKSLGLDLPSLDARPSRQHLVYFPTSSRPDDAAGFVSSDTGTFGGAGRRLEDLLSSVEGNGVAFLAHPLVGRRPGGVEGPDIVPYSRTALNRAWRSPAVLGLQFWNEDARQVSRLKDRHSNAVWKLGDDYVYALPWTGVATTSPDFPWRWPTPQGRTTTQLFEQLYHGAVTWDAFLRKGLADTQTSRLSWLPRGEPRKWFMAGGSDSHGDFNFRREGRPCLEQWCDAPVVDSAIGKPRNLVLVDRSAPASGTVARSTRAAKRYGNREVIDVISAGRFAVTDGPALRIAIDKNRNGRIDLDDYQMGETFHLFPGEHVPLLVEWLSTPEFGPVQKLDVYVGVPERTYAVQEPQGAYAFRAASSPRPLSHGPRNLANQPARSSVAYTQDPAGVLRIDPETAGATGPYAGVARVFLSPDQFDLDQGHGRLFYLRAFAQSQGQESCVTNKEPGSCGLRLAYANPIWGRFIGGCLDDPLAVDADGSGQADVCERSLRDPCGDKPVTTTPAGEMAPKPTTPTAPTKKRRFDRLKSRLQTPAPGTTVATDGHAPVVKKPSPRTSCQFVEAL